MSEALPQELAAWFAENEERLRSGGVTGDLRRSPEDGRPKTSTWLPLEAGEYVAEVIVWSSGEAELAYADLAAGQVSQEHRDLHTSQDLLDAVESIHRWAQAGVGVLPPDAPTGRLAD